MNYLASHFSKIKVLVEAAIHFLFDGMCDSEVIVRWSAAKGIGRIAERLSFDLLSDKSCGLIDEIVRHILLCFVLYGRFGKAGVHAWHGGCLTLAELSRRGLISSSLLPEVVNTLTKALEFDFRTGESSVGEIVRDSACYVLWGLSRSYSSEDLLKIQEFASGKISELLLTLALFDREVNVRRAASATFQECVGRLGEDVFPYGISINTIVDFFSVGNRSDSYKDLPVSIMAAISNFTKCDYGKSFINHLSKSKIFHWDPVIRELAAESLMKLLSLQRYQTLASDIVDFLLFKCGSYSEIEVSGSFLALYYIFEIKDLNFSDKREVHFF
jgi:hypothetical protein